MPLKIKIDYLLNTVPEIDPNSESLKTWKRLNPLKIEIIIQNSSEPLNFDSNKYIYERKDLQLNTWIGMKDKMTKSESGINRFYHKNNNLFEGMYLNGLKHGYGRFIQADGSYHMGQYLNGLRHGNGTFYYSNGAIY